MEKLSKPPVVLSLCLAACSGLLLSPMLVWAATPRVRAACDQCEEADRFIRLQTVAEDDRSANSRMFTHPLMLSRGEWTTLLTRLQVQRRAEGLVFRDPAGPVMPAFTSDEINFLSATLTQAFAQAHPNEMVVFGLSRLNSYHMTEITTGGWFFEGSSLHLVVANYRKAATMPTTRQLLWERPLRPDAGPAYDLVPGPQETRVIDSEIKSNPFATRPSELMIAYPAILAGDSGAPSTPGESSAAPSGTPAPPLSIEDRLRMLKRLHDQGLITDDEYRTKRQQLLEQF